jgi:hypothetical protein
MSCTFFKGNQSRELKLHRLIRIPCQRDTEPGGVIVSYHETEEPLSIEFLNASKRHLFDSQNLQLTIST